MNNIYFDTYENFAYSENLSGVSGRTKLRYRWYGLHQVPQPGTLEIKCKRNYFGWKRRFPVDLSLADEFSNWRDIRGNLISQLEPEGRVWLESNPQPVMINRYDREYYVSRDDLVRVTVDTNQRVFDQRYKSRPNYVNRSNLPKTLVVEVKFDRQHRSLATDIVQGLPLRVSRHSKYMVAVQSILDK